MDGLERTGMTRAILSVDTLNEMGKSGEGAVWGKEAVWVIRLIMATSVSDAEPKDVLRKEQWGISCKEAKGNSLCKLSHNQITCEVRKRLDLCWTWFQLSVPSNQED